MDQIEITANEVNPDVTGGVNILIDETLINKDGVDSLEEGVYTLTLSVTRPDGSTATDTICTALTCQAWCLAIQKLSENPEHYQLAYKLLDALNYLEECDDCDCKYGCVVYNKAIEILSNDVSEDPCDCK